MTAVRAVLFTVFATFSLPAGVAASTTPEASPPACSLPSPTALAGTPYELSGPIRKPDERVGVIARRDDGAYREGTAANLGDRWRAVIMFGAEDAGTWMVDVNVDGVDCISPLTVNLPAGMVAPSTRAPDPVGDEARPAGIDGSTIITWAAIGAAIAVAVSWVALAVIAVSRTARGRAVGTGRLRPLVQTAAFISVLGVFLGFGVVWYFGVSMSHFDSGIPDDQKAVLDLAMVVLLVAGSALGAVAASRVPGRRRRVD